jgi:hypothetical protein
MENIRAVVELDFDAWVLVFGSFPVIEEEVYAPF